MHILLLSTYLRQELLVDGKAIRQYKLTDWIRKLYGNAISEVEYIYRPVRKANNFTTFLCRPS